ncbi:hypothetical protein VitviT2T_023092 [Vitis vinifera]|uniref:Small ribosomal subunit protein uS15c n=1 Tax=Vitis vinifera TaxID=29760 RepID=A0ABY9DBY8_VITVI|nr:hypothetical protein VitviT2T_023092 [Vitis vinifera]
MSLSLDDLYKLAILHKVFGATNIYTTTTADVEGDHRSRHGKALFSPMPAQKRSVSENLVGGGVDDEEEERDEDSLHQHFYRKQPRHLEPDQYFHPDNMSSAEKLKVELKKVRDEFKMSESDCGSARVQVAQLTTKIKHLNSALHKKDKHSRKGLQAMVQRRKKLLKYLRRTDWDSYCLVLSKLGLRDNPNYKN